MSNITKAFEAKQGLRSANLPGYAGGFVQKLFGGGKPAPAAPAIDPRLAQIEASQRALQQSQGTYGSAPAAVTAAPVVSAAPVAGSGGGGMIGNALGVVGARNEALKAAAGYKDGRVPVHEGPGIVHGPGTTTSDSVNAKLSKDEAVLPATTVAALGGPDAVAELIERTNGKAPAMGLRGGQDIHAAWGWVDKAKQMAGDAATAVKNKFNGTPAAPNFAPEMPTGPIPEPTYAPSSAPSPTPPVDYDMPTVERKPLAIPKEYDLTADKGFPRSTNAPVGTNTAPNPTYTGAVPETAAVPPVKNVVPGVQSTAVTPKPIVSPGTSGAIRTAGGATLGMAMGAANKYTDMPIIGGDTDEVNKRNAFYKDPNVPTGDKLINGARDAIDIGLPTIGGGAGLLAGSGLMSIPLGVGGTVAGSVAADGIQTALGDSPLDRYNHKNAMAASEAQRAKLMPLNEAAVNQGHLPNGATHQALDGGTTSITPKLRVDPAEKAKIIAANNAAFEKVALETDINDLPKKTNADTVEKLGLRQLTRDTMGKDAAIPEGAKFAFNQDGTPQMRWSGSTDEAAKTIPRGLGTTNVVKDGGGIVSFNRGNGKFDNVSLGETKYMGKDGTMGAWDKTQQFEDATKLAAKDKARLAELQYQNTKFNATSDQIKDPEVKAAGLRGLAQMNTEQTNQAAMLKSMREAGTAAETARHNRAMEAQGIETGRRTQQNQEVTQQAQRSEAFNSRLDKMIKDATTKTLPDGKEVHDSQAATLMRDNIAKRVDLSKLDINSLNKAFPEMVAEHRFAEAADSSAKNRPTLSKWKDAMDGRKVQINGNTPMKIGRAKLGDMFDVGLGDALLESRTISMGGHTRELSDAIAPDGVFDRNMYDVVVRHLEQQGDTKMIEKLNKKYKVK